MSNTVTKNAVAEAFVINKCNSHFIEHRNKPIVHHLVYKSPLCLGPCHHEFETLNVLRHAVHVLPTTRLVTLQGKPNPHHPAIARMFSPYDEFGDGSEGGRR